jgi:hypothetical protein
MKKIIYIGGSLIITFTFSFLSIYLGSIVAFGSAYSLLAILLWYILPPLILIISVYFGYQNSKSENPSKIFTWTVRVSSIFLVGCLLWIVSFIMRNSNYSNQGIEQEIVLPIVQ